MVCTGQCFHGGRRVSLDLLSQFVRDEGAQDMLEYALLAAFIGIAGWAVLMTLPNVMGATYASWLDTTNGVPGRWDPPEPASAGS
jgi:Flp pilus assembly pilin Flp